MSLFFIGYDLNKTGKKYEELIAKIKTLGSTHWHCLDSTFIIKSALNPIQIRDALAPWIDGDDELLVFELKPGMWASRGFKERCASWLTEVANAA